MTRALDALRDLMKEGEDDLLISVLTEELTWTEALMCGSRIGRVATPADLRIRRGYPRT